MIIVTDHTVSMGLDEEFSGGEAPGSATLPWVMAFFDDEADDEFGGGGRRRSG